MTEYDKNHAEPIISVTLSGSPQSRAIMLTVAMFAGGGLALAVATAAVWMSGVHGASVFLFIVAAILALVWADKSFSHERLFLTGSDGPDFDIIAVWVFVSFLLSLLLDATDSSGNPVSPVLVVFACMVLSLIVCAVAGFLVWLALTAYRVNLARCIRKDAESESGRRV